MLSSLIGTNNDWVLTAVRIVLGVTLFAHGAQKMLGWFGGPGLSATMRTFKDHLHIAAPMAFLAVAAEFFGGLGLIVGLFSRIAALGVAVIMTVAMVTVHLKNGFFMDWFGDKKAHGYEYHLLVIVLALVVMAHGGGAFSLDGAWFQHNLSTVNESRLVR